MYRLDDGDADFKLVHFFPDFHSQIYFAYLGKKQNSEKSVQKFKEKAIVSEKAIQEISEISHAFINCKSINEYNKLIVEHEMITGNVLNETPVKKALFNDFEGEIKSLGAWGGDFVMIASELPIDRIRNYFLGKGIDIIFTFEEMLL